MYSKRKRAFPFSILQESDVTGSVLQITCVAQYVDMHLSLPKNHALNSYSALTTLSHPMPPPSLPTTTTMDNMH